MGQPLGQIFEYALRIQPCAEGSFVVYGGPDTASSRGFTNLVDLMTWLQRAAQAQQAAEVEKVTILNEEQMVPSLSGHKDGKAIYGYQQPNPVVGTDHVYPTKRTTALGSLADRIAAAETPKGAA